MWAVEIKIPLSSTYMHVWMQQAERCQAVHLINSPLV